MSTKYIASNWRLPNQENSSKNDNYGLTFDGSSERIEIPFTKLNGATNCTISFWAKINYSVDSEPKYPLTLTSGTDYDIMWNFGANGTTLDVYIGNLNFRLDGSFNNDIDEWNHWVLRFDGSQSSGNRTKIYQNGQQLTSQAGWGTATSIPTASHLIIGGRNLGSTAWYYQFPGSISDISIFDYTLSESQISTLYGSSSLGSGNPMILNPVAYYPLGDNSASNPLTQPNVAVEDASVFNFDGSDDFISTDGPNFTSSFSFSGWFKTTSTSTETIWAALDGSTNKHFLRLSGGNTIRVKLFDASGGNTNTDNTTTYNDGNWHHISFTTDGLTTSNGIKVYLDGSLLSTQGTLSNAGFISTNKNNIGAYNASTWRFSGELSNIQLWDAELSASDVTTLYNSGVPLYTGTQPQAANLKAWYKLNNTANWEADSSGNWQIPEATSAYPQSFKCDSGWIDLNGSNLAPILNGISNFTLSLWYKQDAISNRFVFDIKDGANRMALQLVNAATNYLYFNSSYNSYSAVDTPINQWNNLVFVFDGSEANADRIKLFINGSQITAATTGTIDSTLGSFGSSTVANLGAASTGGSLYALNGKISNCQIFNSSLPATGTDSVETLYNNGSPLTTAIASSNLKLWAKLDNNEKFDGTNWSVENQKYPAGFDSCLNFDGSNDDISITQSNLGTSNTISLWYKSNGKTPSYFTLLGDSTAPNEYAIWVQSGSTIWYKVQDASNGSINWSVSNVDDGKWHNFVFARTNTTVNFYIDGNLQTVNSNTLANNDTKIDSIGSKPTLGDFFKGELSNLVIWNSDQSSEKDNIYNNGTPSNSYTNTPVSWWKLNNLTTGIQDSVGSNDGTNNGATKVNTFVSTEAATSSGMTEQNLVNNNVSALNGESSGMTSANLVTSDLTRAIPYDNYSFNFDSASADYIDLGSPSALDFETGEMTLSCWINLETLSGIKPILGNSNSGITSYQYLLDANRTTAKISFLTSGVPTLTSSLTISANTWYHICLTRSGTTSNWVYTMYINGSSSDGATASTTANPPATQTTAIGRYGAAGGYYFQGKISNFSAFNEALTSTEVLKLYSNGVPQDLSSFTPQPAAWYPLGSNSFWNGSNWTVRDMSAGGSNDGTSANIGADGLVGDAPRSEANGTGTNMDVPSNLEGNTKWSSNNSYSVNMSSEARKQDTP